MRKAELLQQIKDNTDDAQVQVLIDGIAYPIKMAVSFQDRTRVKILLIPERSVERVIV